VVATSQLSFLFYVTLMLLLLLLLLLLLAGFFSAHLVLQLPVWAAVLGAAGTHACEWQHVLAAMLV
jgi:hypothetical protein